MKDDSVDHDSNRPIRIGLALSGGGFRASIFHLGVIRRLEELGVMKRIHTISAVSGGSIVAAYYVTEMEKRLRLRREEIKKRPHNIDKVRRQIFEEIAESFFRALDRNLRSRAMLFSPFFHPLLFFKSLWPSCSRSDLIQGEYDKWFFRNNTMDHLPAVTLQDSKSDHKNCEENLFMRGPQVIINTTSLMTGERKGFKRESVSRLRELHRVNVNALNLSTVVGASSGVPGVFPPTAIWGVKYVDGGVSDNQGLDSLISMDRLRDDDGNGASDCGCAKDSESDCDCAKSVERGCENDESGNSDGDCEKESGRHCDCDNNGPQGGNCDASSSQNCKREKDSKPGRDCDGDTRSDCACNKIDAPHCGCDRSGGSDGGNYDVLLVSDASGQMEPVHRQSSRTLKVLSRVVDILKFQLRRRNIRLLRRWKRDGGCGREFAFVHLYLNLKGRKNRARVPSEYIPAIGKIRTDLDQFSFIEREVLMYHGYTSIDAQIRDYCKRLKRHTRRKDYCWRELQKPPLFRLRCGEKHRRRRVKHVLEVGRSHFFLWRSLRKYPVKSWIVYGPALLLLFVGWCGFLGFVQCIQDSASVYIKPIAEFLNTVIINCTFPAWVCNGLSSIVDCLYLAKIVSKLSKPAWMLFWLYVVWFLAFAAMQKLVRQWDVDDYRSLTGQEPTVDWSSNESK